ncbi:MAG: hypothetical protein UW68_C0006G0019 [Candidatus Collierbacteria bacterium GW2011_GWB1_44_6]|uniref:Uncharacterized protein n=2 Tax=Candidatus Collieribacteriota TaxID=1752725 RepID=A0A0G1LXM7_9BACT|nr:MAG: hypothetical protein UW68_C0006G0019 [Candidatus Collierbacteria bacterium GW2011_GWB1_44_6]KKT83254.1 MAG: hypothetical protein UW80_C0018G0005 [Microgenomates group bacterium GW2011_GWC1_44_9]
MAKFDKALEYVDVDRHWGNLPFTPVIGVTRLFDDGSEKFVSNAELAAEKAAAEQAALEAAELLAAQEHDAEMREEGSDEQFERMVSALDNQFPGFRKELNEKAKRELTSRREAYRRMLAAEAEVDEHDENLADYVVLGYKGRTR